MGAKHSNASKKGDKNLLLPREKDKTAREQNEKTCLGQESKETEPDHPSKEEHEAEIDVSERRETESFSQDDARATEKKRTASSSATEKLEVDSVGAPSATNKILMDGDLAHAVEEGDVIVSFPGTASEFEDVSHGIAHQIGFQISDEPIANSGGGDCNESADRKDYIDLVSIEIDSIGYAEGNNSCGRCEDGSSNIGRADEKDDCDCPGRGSDVRSGNRPPESKVGFNRIDNGSGNKTIVSDKHDSNGCASIASRPTAVTSDGHVNDSDRRIGCYDDDDNDVAKIVEEFIGGDEVSYSFEERMDGNLDHNYLYYCEDVDKEVDYEREGEEEGEKEEDDDNVDHWNNYCVDNEEDVDGGKEAGEKEGEEEDELDDNDNEEHWNYYNEEEVDDYRNKDEEEEGEEDDEYDNEHHWNYYCEDNEEDVDDGKEEGEEEDEEEDDGGNDKDENHWNYKCQEDDYYLAQSPVPLPAPFLPSSSYPNEDDEGEYFEEEYDENYEDWNEGDWNQEEYFEDDEEEYEEDFWDDDYEDGNYMDECGAYAGSLYNRHGAKGSQLVNDSIKKGNSAANKQPFLDDVNKELVDFRTSNGVLDKDAKRSRNGRSFPKDYMGRRKTGNGSETHSRITTSRRLGANAFLVSGLSERTTKDGLLNFVEVISGGEVQEIIMLEQGKALVTMTTPVQDVQKMKEKCIRRSLDSNTVRIEIAPAPTSILVSGLSSTASIDLVRLYFESPRSGGGSVASVHFIGKEGQAVVTFDDAQDVKRVLAKQEEKPHVVDGIQLTVSVFHGGLQDFNRDVADEKTPFPVQNKFDERRVTHQSTPKTTQEFHLVVDPDLMEYVHKSSHMNQLRTLLEDKSCVIDWTPGSKHAVIVCDGPPNGNYGQGVDAAQSYLDKFVKWDVQIEKELWKTLVEGSMAAIYGRLEGDPPLIKGITDDSFFYLRIVSIKSEKEFYDENLQEALDEIYFLERRKNYRAESITNISEERIELLKKTNFEKKLREEFMELIVEFDDENGEIHFEGPEEEVTNAIMRYCEQDAKTTEKELHLSKSVLEVLNTAEGLQVVKDKMAANAIEAVFVIEEDESNPSYLTAKVLGITPEHAHNASYLINSLTAETIVNIKEKDVALTTMPKWDDICEEIEKNNKVVIRRDETGRTWVAGFTKDVITSVRRLNTFLQENATEATTETYTCPSKEAKIYLRTYRKKDILAIENKLDVKILDSEDFREFVISGKEEGLKLARNMLDALVREVLTKELKIKQPGLCKLFSSGKADDLVKKVEKDYECLVRVEKTLPKNKRHLPREMLPESDSESEDEEIVDVEDLPTASFPSKNSTSFLLTAHGHNISWKTGNIAKEQAHTIVSSQGACANAIMQSAGPGIQPQTHPPAGEIRVSSGFKLPYQHVIHTRCSEWNGGHGETTLRAIVQKSLRKVDELKGSSIAFPVIGTGNLQFPRNEASRIMLDEVVNFCHKNPHSSVKDIRFVIFNQDQSLVTAFQQEMSRLQTSLGRTFPNESDFTWWQKVEVVQGNLIEERGDAIVNINGKDMNLFGAGELSKAVARAGGERVIQECRRLGQQPGGSAVMTSGGNLPARHIIHLVPESSNKQHLRTCLEKCLLLASQQGLRSVSIPAVGTGAYRMAATDSAQLTFQALSNLRGNCSNMSRIRIVIYQRDMLEAFTQEHHRVTQEYHRVTQAARPSSTVPTSVAKMERKKSTRKVSVKKKKRTKMTSSQSDSTVNFSVTAANETTANSALQSLKTGFLEVCTKQVISSECVSQLSERQISALLQKSKQRDVDLKIEPAINRIEARGDANDVTAMIGAIWRELNEREKRTRAREHANLLAGHVEWRYILFGKTNRFSSTKNAKIEEAYSKKFPSVTVGIRGDTFLLTFKNNRGTGRLSGERIKISRKVLGTAEGLTSLPAHWAPMPKQRNGNDVTVHTVKLACHSTEFQDVAQAFQKTAASAVIKSVERIQNPLLYQAYQLRKQKMDRDNGGNNERQLFHGTASGNVKKINAQGFNRNFSGVAHGTALGKGVYFARDASYSMRYTPQGTGNSRFMYLARVLVGRYCHGDPKLVVPPPRNASRPEVLFDSVVDDTSNPGIYVVFSDSQCYPEYLISF